MSNMTLMRTGYLRAARKGDVKADDYDVLVWQEVDGWHWLVLRVRGGVDVEKVAAGGPEPTRDKAAEAGEAKKPC